MRRSALSIDAWCLWALILVAISACDAPVSETQEPRLVVPEQYFIGGQVLVKQVVTPEVSFVVVWRGDAEGPDVGSGVIGAMALEAGTRRKMKVPVHLYLDVHEAATMWATLHADTDGNGTFDPAADRPITHRGEPVQRTFDLYGTDGTPNARLIVEDQHVVRELVLGEVHVTEPAAVVIHWDNGKNTGPRVPGIMGIVDLEPGTHTDVPIRLYDEFSVACGEQIWPMLHVRTTGSDQPYRIDHPIITVPVINTCE